MIWPNLRTGRFGEKIAKKFLIAKGVSIRAENFTTPFGEIDLVAEDNQYIVFVEVKTRISETFGPPLLSITPKKQTHILKNCRYYLNRYGLYNAPCRIDVIGIKLNMNKQLEKLEYVKNAITVQLF